MVREGVLTNKRRFYNSAFALSYLLALRVSELNKITLADISIYKTETSKIFLRVRTRNLKNGKMPIKNLITPFNLNGQEKKIIKKALAQYIYLINPILKKYGYTWKQWIARSPKIPLIEKDEITKELSNIYMYPSSVSNSEKFKLHKNISRVGMWKAYSRYVNKNPHFFRKLRATHLYNIYQFSLKELQRFMGHSDVRSSTPYTLVNLTNIENKFLDAEVH